MLAGQIHFETIFFPPFHAHTHTSWGKWKELRLKNLTRKSRQLKKRANMLFRQTLSLFLHKSRRELNPFSLNFHFLPYSRQTKELKISLLHKFIGRKYWEFCWLFFSLNNTGAIYWGMLCSCKKAPFCVNSAKGPQKKKQTEWKAEGKAEWKRENQLPKTNWIFGEKRKYK